MSTTQYLNLNKPSGSDLVNPLTDTFPNWDIVDNAYHGLDIRAIGRATELVSQGVHALTVLDSDCKTIKWTATANFTAGETFTVNGIQCNAYIPSGEALGTNAYVTGAQVIGSLNDDNSAITIYVPQGAVAVASDSERLGGELPSYYATKDYADGIKSTADNASELIGKKALVNTYYDTSTNKMYTINADGTIGGEISMSQELDVANATLLTTTAITTSKSGAIHGNIYNAASGTINIGGMSIPFNNSAQRIDIDFIPADTSISLSVANASPYALYFIPYK